MKKKGLEETQARKKISRRDFLDTAAVSGIGTFVLDTATVPKAYGLEPEDIWS